VQSLVERLAPAAHLEVGESKYPLLDEVRQCRLRLGDHTLGVLGELSPAGMQRFETRWPTTVAEIDLDLLASVAHLVATTRPLSPYPPVTRDLNLIVAESVHWAEVEALVRQSGGELLESIQYQETYRHPQHIGAGKKSLLFTLQLRSATGTLTSEEADAVRDRIVAVLAERVGGALRA
jgi:phenylalanyl-tRNA synthetase beta chain